MNTRSIRPIVVAVVLGVAVIGCGGVGLNTIQAAKMVGAGKIIAVDVNKQKLTWAEEFGATHAVDASTEDPVARVHAISGMGGGPRATRLPIASST